MSSGNWSNGKGFQVITPNIQKEFQGVYKKNPFRGEEAGQT